MPAGSSINTSLDLPRLCAEIPGCGGELRVEPGDFAVDEIPQYEAAGDGQHLFLRVEKTNRTTDEIVQWLRGLGFREIGTAGIKDKRAVTRQYVSVERRLWQEEFAARAPEGIRVLSAVPHGNKLKTGHLRGNRFTIRIRNAAPVAEHVRAVTERITTLGLPNFFGEQRFGREGDNAAAGLRVMRGEIRPPKQKAQFLISALQSELFNRYLARRMREGTWRTVLPGDVLKKADTGGMFTTTDPAADQPRLDAGELVPAGPMFGPAMVPAGDAAAALEDAILREAGLDRDIWARSRVATTGTRRALLVYPKELTAGIEAPDTLLVTFILPKGSFATVLLREYMGT